ncbi:MAG: hypothetical protein LKI23_00845 [Bifidobacterium crudilactis]|nr:hypothetical protein [Bifidobacterium crudilactis]
MATKDTTAEKNDIDTAKASSTTKKAGASRAKTSAKGAANRQTHGIAPQD